MIAAMRANGVKRLVVLSSPAVADADDRPGLFYRAARVLLRVVMPGVVPRTGRYEAGPMTPGSGARISRADLADVMVATATDDEFFRMKPLVSESRLAAARQRPQRRCELFSRR